MKEQWLEQLIKISEKPGRFDLSEAALFCAAARYDFKSIDKYKNHLKKLQAELKSRLKSNKQDTAQALIETLRDLLLDQESYGGDLLTPEDIQNNSLAHTIDRRKGGSMCLAIITASAARAAGLHIDILGFPGYVLCRLEHESARIIFDPYKGFAHLEASDMRALLKDLAGERAELSHEYYEPLGEDDCLLRLENTIKFKQIAMEDYKGALDTALIIRAFAPETLLLELELGILYAKTGEPFRAVSHLETFIAKTGDSRDRAQAIELLESLKATLK